MKLNEATENRPTLFVAIGASGSGKSTLFKKLEHKYPGLQSFSLDTLRHKFYDPDDYKKAWEASTKDSSFRSRANQEYIDLIDQKKDVFVDNTNLTPKARRFYIQEAKRRGYKTVGITFPDVDVDILIARQQTRGDKTVPADAVRQQWSVMKGPEAGEFDETTTANRV